MKVTYFNNVTGGFVDLNEVSIVASVEELHGLISLIQNAIDTHKEHPELDHIHLRDTWDKWREEYSDVIIFVKDSSAIEKNRPE